MTVKAKLRKRKKRQTPKVESVPLPTRKRQRRGKHWVLMTEVLKQLGNLGDNSAIKIPLGHVSAKTMRSAVFRATSKHDIEITSFSDQDYLYIVKQ